MSKLKNKELLELIENTLFLKRGYKRLAAVMLMELNPNYDRSLQSLVREHLNEND